jgi:hypothetical protein
MKLMMRCTETIVTSGSHGGPLYIYKFAVKHISDDWNIQKEGGMFNLTSTTPLDYKWGKEYSMKTPSILLLI